MYSSKKKTTLKDNSLFYENEIFYPEITRFYFLIEKGLDVLENDILKLRKQIKNHPDEIKLIIHKDFISHVTGIVLDMQYVLNIYIKNIDDSKQKLYYINSRASLLLFNTFDWHSIEMLKLYQRSNNLQQLVKRYFKC